MTLSTDSLELGFVDVDFGLSARRLWEHTELGQINVFTQAISARPELNDATAFIDVIWFEGEAISLAGLTLADLVAGRIPRNSRTPPVTGLPGFLRAGAVEAFVRSVAAHLDRCAMRQAVRNQHHQFLPTARADGVFGVPLIFSTLQRRLRAMGRSKAGAGQWQKTIENFQQKGLRAEEFQRANLMPALMELDADGDQISAVDLASQCDFGDLRLSVIPVVSDAEHQLRFSVFDNRRVKRTMNLPKAQAGQTREVAALNPILGYRIEQVEHRTLWGTDRHWQAVTHDGQVISNAQDQTLFATRDEAASLAASHARQHFPKRVALGQFSSYAWTGGKEYREWLITLPHFPASYLAGHFNVRNVLAHVRCDLREGADGERVLLLQEVQSDWAQDARRQIASGDMNPHGNGCPPFLKEWPALAMKLVLLHAAHEGLDAVAWTRGAHQAFRYKGLGATGLTELYDRTMPREVNRMIKPFGGVCEMLGVYVPTNFRIRQSEDGYNVYTADNKLLGIAPTLEDARQLVPEGAHELLYEVHGVRLPAAVRKAILEAGFPAWG